MIPDSPIPDLPILTILPPEVMPLKYTLSLVVLLSVFGTSLCWAQGGQPLRLASEVPERVLLLGSDASERLLEEGRAQVLDFQLYEAERTFRRLDRQPDGRAAARYYLASASFLKALVTDERVYFDEFYERYDSLRLVLKGLPASRWKTYLLAEAYLQFAFVAVKNESYFRSALAGRKAYALFRDLIADDAAFYEPYKGMGLMHLFIGTMPKGQRRLLKVLGYGGTIQQGLRELEDAAAHSRLNQDEASIYLALADVTLNNSAAGGVEILARLHRTHPESAFLAYLYGFALLSNRRAVEAEDLLREAVEAGTTAEYFFIDYAEFSLAEALFRQNRFTEAEPFYRHYLKRHRGEALKALALYELGLTLEMQGRRAEALPLYRQIQGDRIYDTDRWAYRAAQKRAAAPLTARQRQLVLGRNAYDAGAYDQAAVLLQAVFDDDGASTAERAEASYRLGRVFHAQGRLDEALRAYYYAVAHPPTDPMARWAPWSRFYAAEIYVQRGDTPRARAAFEAVLAYDEPFDYQEALEQQAKAALGRLKGD